MNASNGVSASIWLANTWLPQFPVLDGDANADVCVIGAGIGGLTTAYRLPLVGGRQSPAWPRLRSASVGDAAGRRPSLSNRRPDETAGPQNMI